MPDRRSFLRTAVAGSGLLLVGAFPFQSFAADANNRRLTILYTSDVHGRTEVFPKGPFEGMGGVVACAALINKIRNEGGNVLLLDAGDMLQPAPYLDISSAKNMFHKMQQMGYDATTFGAYDMVNGMGFLADALPQEFPVIATNHSYADAALSQKILPWMVINKGGIRVGIFALGNSKADDLKRNKDTLKIAQITARKLNTEHRCDFVICLSRLEENATNVDIGNDTLIKGTDCIDLIISGGTHAFEGKPAMALNRLGKEVLITTAGWGGIKIGRLDYVFDSKNGSKLRNAQSVIVGKQTSPL